MNLFTDGRCRMLITGLLVLGCAGFVITEPQASGARKRARQWVGQPASALTSVFGAPDLIRERRRNSIYIWYRYPLTTFAELRDLAAPGRHYDPSLDTDPPPIPGDPTAAPARVIECTAKVGHGGVIVSISMPEQCQIPEFGVGDSASGKTELPQEQESVLPELPRAKSAEEERPPHR